VPVLAGRAEPTIDELVKTYPGKVKVVLAKPSAAVPYQDA